MKKSFNEILDKTDAGTLGDLTGSVKAETVPRDTLSRIKKAVIGAGKKTPAAHTFVKALPAISAAVCLAAALGAVFVTGVWKNVFPELSETSGTPASENTYESEAPGENGTAFRTAEEAPTALKTSGEDGSGLSPAKLDPAVICFDNMAEFKAKLIDDSFSESERRYMERFKRALGDAALVSAENLLELGGLSEDHGFEQTMIEWTGGPYYCINYVGADGALLAMMRKGGEDRLKEALAAKTRDTGRYETLKNNSGISGLSREYTEGAFCTREIYTYDTNTTKGIRASYAEYGYGGRKFTVVETYFPNGTEYHDIFVFDGENSFEVLTSKELTDEETVGLCLVRVE